MRFVGELTSVVRNAGRNRRRQPERDQAPARRLDLRPRHGGERPELAARRHGRMMLPGAWCCLRPGPGPADRPGVCRAHHPPSGLRRPRRLGRRRSRGGPLRIPQHLRRHGWRGLAALCACRQDRSRPRGLLRAVLSPGPDRGREPRRCSPAITSRSCTGRAFAPPVPLSRSTVVPPEASGNGVWLYPRPDRGERRARGARAGDRLGRRPGRPVLPADPGVGPDPADRRCAIRVGYRRQERPPLPLGRAGTGAPGPIRGASGVGRR